MKHKNIVLAITALLAFLPMPAHGGAKYKVLHAFGDGTDGSGPFGPLILDGRGNLYGVTGTGGTGQCSDYGCGTVYELTPTAGGTWKESILHNFQAGSDGAFPYGGLAFDAVGSLYGTLQGDNGLGGSGVFRQGFVAGGWTNSLIYTQGAGPGLLIDGLGNLYGEMGPGQEQGGAIGELSPGLGEWNYTQLYSFNGTDGLAPPTPPIWDAKGNMFGTTAAGGIRASPCQTISGCGVVYEMIPDGDGTWSYHVLHRFASFKNDGQTPYGGLVMDSAGNFYGSTAGGGREGQGTIFQLEYVGGKWRETILYDFPSCAHGCGPNGTLALDKQGNLYGTASGGGTGKCGPYTCGVAFELSPQENGKWKYAVLYNFTAESGGYGDFYGVILDGKGNLFGVTSAFGKYGGGTAFEITP